jgi:hypothetical protein
MLGRVEGSLRTQDAPEFVLLYTPEPSVVHQTVPVVSGSKLKLVIRESVCGVATGPTHVFPPFVLL